MFDSFKFYSCSSFHDELAEYVCFHSSTSKERKNTILDGFAGLGHFFCTIRSSTNLTKLPLPSMIHLSHAYETEGGGGGGGTGEHCAPQI